LLIING